MHHVYLDIVIGSVNVMLEMNWPDESVLILKYKFKSNSICNVFPAKLLHRFSDSSRGQKIDSKTQET